MFFCLNHGAKVIGDNPMMQEVTSVHAKTHNNLLLVSIESSVITVDSPIITP